MLLLFMYSSPRSHWLRRARNDPASNMNSGGELNEAGKIHRHCEEPDEIGRRSNPLLQITKFI